ncbi:uncharacterized protein BDR25DRAFT_277817 [Lindgomyces ingoldianus]|uniref:Uncharacterized protein n=1 Tax=Lindgomyces ingoldianus TaxID=673940 RepID=A0ACB6RCW9_9PLEO|nr:uncharacterized protein BDR25DRAFT_277817 [Lindgomyces ingoldianus]KAF2476575.1 hypothetical protein BDR25DRAFT_277817 [Lindgomyces ingoldianus]
MDDLLPSYESAIEQNPWELVAKYLPSDDLCSAALVCQKWFEIFTPRLWGNPASHFGVQNDTVYVALTRFKRTLFWSRLCVRELTHTLHLPPAHAEIYGGPHCEWLRDCLERLPNLQCLIVNGLPFFDHASLLTLRHSSLWWRSNHPSAFPVFGLRLLDASGCSNATSTGLSEALTHFPDLVSLDLSRTIAAKDETVLSKLKFLRNLRVLKLRGLGLRDSDFSIIAISVGTRVRSLDVRENHLTDGSARLLLNHCLKETSNDFLRPRSPLPPVRHSRPLGETDIFGTEDLDAHLRKKLTQGFVGSLAIEEARDVGVTHLYLSKNSVTVEGFSGLLRSRRLQVLDIGTPPTVLQRPQNLLEEEEEEDEDLILPGVEKLTPVLAEYAAERMVYLRINYAVVTEDAPVDRVPSLRAELGGDLAKYTPSGAHELEATEPPQPELESTDNAIYELPGDLVRPVELPLSSPLTEATQTSQESTSLTKDVRESMKVKRARTPTIEVTPEKREIKRGPAYAPEPVWSKLPLSPVSPILDISGGLSPIANFMDGATRTSSVSSDEERQTITKPRQNSTYYVEDRRARLDLRQAKENRFHPGMIPKAHTLVLTDVPTTTENPEIVRRLIQFIKDCAEEAYIARLRAKHTYALPPGRSRTIAEREYARSLFALRRIVFEMSPPQAAPKKISTSWRQYPTKSSTEDADSEAFWEAATHDFSFFGDEECGLPNAEPGRHLPLTAMSGLMLAPHRPAPAPKSRQPNDDFRPVFDVVSEIARFRNDRKAVYHGAMQYGEQDPFVEDYWPGDISVVRKPIDSDPGHVDYYGNRYESGYLYR